MRKLLPGLFCLFLCIFSDTLCRVNNQLPGFNVLVLYENGGHHIPYSTAAKTWLNKPAADSNFPPYITGTEETDDDYLSRYQLFLQPDSNGITSREEC